MMANLSYPRLATAGQELFRCILAGCGEIIVTLGRLPQAGRMNDGMRRINCNHEGMFAAAPPARAAEVDRVFGA